MTLASRVCCRKSQHLHVLSISISFAHRLLVKIIFFCVSTSFSVTIGKKERQCKIDKKIQKGGEKGSTSIQVLLLNPGDTQMLVDSWGKYDFFLYKHPLLNTLPTTRENKSSIRKMSSVFYLGTKSQKDQLILEHAPYPPKWRAHA